MNIKELFLDLKYNAELKGFFEGKSNMCDVIIYDLLNIVNDNDNDILKEKIKSYISNLRILREKYSYNVRAYQLENHFKKLENHLKKINEIMLGDCIDD